MRTSSCPSPGRAGALTEPQKSLFFSRKKENGCIDTSMNNNLMTLRAAAAMLGVPAHVIVYAITSGKAQEPLRISGRRMFAETDLDQLRKIVAPAGRRGKDRHD